MHPFHDKKQWQAAYRAMSEALERVRARELAAMTDEDARRIIESLSVVGTPWRERPDWSGLEQQAIFTRFWQMKASQVGSAEPEVLGHSQKLQRGLSEHR